jgi:Transposase DDE domain
MIFANSLPDAKAFFAAAGLPATTVGLLTRFLVACLSTLRSAAQAADAIRTDPRHRAQLVRFLARRGWSRDWRTLERLAGAVLDACLHEQGDWLFLLDQTTHTTLGRHAQNTYSCRNTKERPRHSRRRQKKTPPKLNHVFVCGLLISPQTGTRLPCVRPYYTERYCAQRAARAEPGAPTFATQADIAADLIRAVRVPAGSRVLVLGDTAFEAGQVRAACRARGFDWITPANPERVLAGPKPRRRLTERGRDLDPTSLTRIELCPGLTAWWRHQRGSAAKAWRGKYARRYWARAEALDVHHLGRVLAVFSTNEQPQAGQKVGAKKVLVTNLLHWDARRVVGAYATRWQIELFFRELKSDLGLSHYRVRDFREVEGWVQACGIAFCYLEWYRLRRRAPAERPEWWFRQRTRGLALQVRQEIEWADLQQVATEMETAEGRARLRACLRRAVPLEQRRSA